MCPGIRPATGWMAYFDLTTVLLDQVGQLPHRMLGLSDGQAVAGNDDHQTGIGQPQRRILDGDLVDREPLGALAGTPSASVSPEGPKEDVGKRAIHGLAHDLGEDQARRPHQSTGDDQHLVVDDEPGHARLQYRNRNSAGR